MKYRKLGTAGVDISAIVMGCWAIGGGYTWGHQDEKMSIDTVRAAVDLGVNIFDTAEFTVKVTQRKCLAKAYRVFGTKY